MKRVLLFGIVKQKMENHLLLDLKVHLNLDKKYFWKELNM